MDNQGLGVGPTPCFHAVINTLNMKLFDIRKTTFMFHRFLNPPPPKIIVNTPWLNWTKLFVFIRRGKHLLRSIMRPSISNMQVFLRTISSISATVKT